MEVAMIQNRKYFICDNERLALRLEGHRSEEECFLHTGILRACNTFGTPSYRACDMAEARLATHEAREKGNPFGSDWREPAKAVKKSEDEKGEMEGLDFSL